MRYNRGMVTTLLITHIAFMSISLIVTMGTVFISILGHRVTRTIITGNILGTSLGLLCGSILLFTVPLDAKCITLGAYLLAFIAAQVYVANRNQRLLALSSAV